MYNHSQIINELSNFLIIRGKVQKDTFLDLTGNTMKYRPDLLFENIDTKIKVIVEVKTNEKNLNISFGTLSHLMELKTFLDNYSDYKFIVVFTDKLSLDYSSTIEGRITYCSLKEKSLSEIAQFIYEVSMSNNIA